LTAETLTNEELEHLIRDTKQLLAKVAADVET
jgi:hypothetical protein